MRHSLKEDADDRGPRALLLAYRRRILLLWYRLWTAHCLKRRLHAMPIIRSRLYGTKLVSHFEYPLDKFKVKVYIILGYFHLIEFNSVYAANATQVLWSLGNVNHSVLVKPFKNVLSRRCIEGCGCLGISQCGKTNALVVMLRQDWNEGAQRRDLNNCF